MWWDTIDYLSAPDSMIFFLHTKVCRKVSCIAGVLCVLFTAILAIITGEVDIVSMSLHFIVLACAAIIGFCCALFICKFITKIRAVDVIIAKSFTAELYNYLANERESETRVEILTYIEALEKGRGRLWLYDGQLTGGY